ncbi:bifunctional diguanylate cyclase/phosphodiesterase [Actinotalea sp. K2]|uniref:putative bifunctional diguanylate cyclase/phosphodiesterase n=1 Tax=Actinotalea sp. K2 TaxID=2939438 RepID=UPI0020183870|nr:GGDEF domain-containing phosphodiesterase [Actinotalea sp. K2]MCL3859750.1 EAL domain-containing protein [Actinotalea sp. K2]
MAPHEHADPARRGRHARAGIGGGETRRRQFATLLEHSPDATVILDEQGLVCEWNPAAEALLGRSRSDVHGIAARSIVPDAHRPAYDALWADLLRGRPTPPGRLVWQQSNGAEMTVRAHVAPIRADDRFAGAVAILRTDPGHSGQDGHRRLEAVAAPRFAGVERDELTGLPGRRVLQQRLAAPLGPGRGRGVALLDLDGLALVNEAYGHDAGDAVLAEMARRLLTVGGSGLGRWQADSFVWVTDTPDPAVEIERLIRAVGEVLDEPFQVGDDSLRLTVSTGAVTTDLAHGADLLAAATDALRVAKDSGRDRVVWYSEVLRTSPTGAFRLANDLQQGIRDGELRLHFQPIMELATNQVLGVEALVRWERPGAGLLGPASFLDVAERTGQILELGRWVTQSACRAAAELVGTGALRNVSINVSARQLGDPELADMLRTALLVGGCEASALTLEVTETALMHDLPAAAATLDLLKGLGVGVDLDDFGTGYSSLLYLKHFPVDRLKIDQSFVAGLGSDSADTAIVASTIALAHSIGIRAVAEGVETSDQLVMLRQLGCDFVQGYLLARPMPLDEFAGWLVDHDPSRYDGSAPSGAAPAPEGAARDLAADLRDRRGDDREVLADAREVLADERDEIADERQGVADVREWQADDRDVAADLRDDVADDRDDVADVRDEVADVRDQHAAGRESRSASDQP